MPGYNERAWAIDVLSEINRVVGNHQVPIQRAGGEYSVAEADRHLFPDVLLFKDPHGAVILQGWELKFPDTDISDDEFFDNAKRKADALGLDSFLLWNVTYAELYRRVEDKFERRPVTRWDDLSDIRGRNQVRPAENRWKTLLGVWRFKCHAGSCIKNLLADHAPDVLAAAVRGCETLRLRGYRNFLAHSHTGRARLTVTRSLTTVSGLCQ